MRRTGIKLFKTPRPEAFEFRGEAPPQFLGRRSQMAIQQGLQLQRIHHALPFSVIVEHDERGLRVTIDSLDALRPFLHFDFRVKVVVLTQPRRRLPVESTQRVFRISPMQANIADAAG